MCGRYVIKTSTPELARIFGLDPAFAHLAGGNEATDPAVDAASATLASYNIAPTQNVPVCRVDANRQRELRLMHWGLVPAWAEDRKTAFRMINARAETVAERPAFRTAVRKRRCLIPASGFYEWAKVGQSKQPYFIGLDQADPFAFAGLWEKWRSPTGDSLHSCTIITTVANDRLKDIHPRMPVILAPESYERWLSGTDRASILGLLEPYSTKAMVAYPVSTFVNSVRNNDERCTQPLSDDPARSNDGAASAGKDP